MSLKRIFATLLTLALTAAPFTSSLADTEGTVAPYPTTTNSAPTVEAAEETAGIEDEAAAATPVQYPTEEATEAEEEYSFE